MGTPQNHGFIKKTEKIVDPLILQFFLKVKYNCGNMGLFSYRISIKISACKEKIKQTSGTFPD